MAMLSCPAGQTSGGDGVFAPNSGTTETGKLSALVSADAETEDENKTDDTDDPAPSPDVYWNDYELTILRDCIPGFKGKSLKRNLELIKEGIESQADQDCAETTEVRTPTPKLNNIGEALTTSAIHSSSKKKANTIEEDEVVDNSNTGQGKTKKKSAASKSAAGTEEGKTKKTTNNTPEGDVPESSAAGQRKGRKKSSTSMQVADTDGVKAKKTSKSKDFRHGMTYAIDWYTLVLFQYHTWIICKNVMSLECHPLSHLSHAYHEKSQGQVTYVVLSLSLLCIQVWNGIPSLNCDMHIMTRVKWRLHVQIKDATSSAYHRHLYTSMAHSCCSFRFLFCFHVQIELHGYEWHQGNRKI
ncbi:hypothetical protein EJB05_05741, partial [Eragrostis curvula]